MSRFLLILGLVILAYNILPSQPVFVIEGGDTVNWGIIKSNEEKLTKKVKFLNKSKTDTLKIYSVKPGCGCTTAPLDKDKIPPMGSATLDVTLNVSTYTGEVHKTITINSSDPDNRYKTLHLVANIFQALSHFPRFMNFPASQLNKADTAKVVLNNHTDKDIKIEEINVDPPDFNLSVKKGAVIPSKGSLTVTAVYTPKTQGRYSGTIKMKTNSEEAPKETIQIYGYVRENNPGDKPK